MKSQLNLMFSQNPSHQPINGKFVNFLIKYNNQSFKILCIFYQFQPFSYLQMLTVVVLLYQINVYSLLVIDNQLYSSKFNNKMQIEGQKQYVLEDIMKKRRKDKEAVENKLRNKIKIKGKKQKKKQAIKGPQKFIKRYRSAQRSYAHLRNQNKKVAHTKITKSTQMFGKLILAIRIRGVEDISDRQKLILNKFRLKNVNSAVFIKGTAANLKQLRRVQNYITYGQPSMKIIKQLIYKKMHGKVGDTRILINTNELVQQHIGGDIICFEDIISQIYNLGSHFKQINEFIYPFKLTTPPNTLMSRLRKPVKDGGHWGYRGTQINQYVANMI